MTINLAYKGHLKPLNCCIIFFKIYYFIHLIEFSSIKALWWQISRCFGEHSQPVRRKIINLAYKGHLKPLNGCIIFFKIYYFIHLIDSISIKALWWQINRCFRGHSQANRLMVINIAVV